MQLTVVILTKNESIHIQRAINNVKGWADHILILDSYSDDNTVQLAKGLGAEVIFRKFDNYKNQRQYAIDYCKDLTEWMFFLDADEYILESLKGEIKTIIGDKSVDGYYMSCRLIFMGKWIKHGGYYPLYLLRLFRPRFANVDRDINEHVKIQGVVKKLTHDLVDQNLKGINFWIEKHNQYATREAQALLLAKATKNRRFCMKGLMITVQAERKKWIRENVWNYLPLLLKSFMYFIYRYFLRLGFLDGREGLVFHFLQGCWFQFLIDVKYLEKIKINTVVTEP